MMGGKGVDKRQGNGMGVKAKVATVPVLKPF